MKEQILKLRKEGKNYNEISNLTGASKATISYHCKRHGLDGRIDGMGLVGKSIDEINEYYKTHTIIETAEYFNIGVGTVKSITENKRILLTEDELVGYNYRHVKDIRRRNKEKAVALKGGKCVKCGYNKSIRALEFHHTDATEKEFNPSGNMNMAWHKIEKEIEKCILVCSNCHREIHEQLDRIK